MSTPTTQIHLDTKGKPIAYAWPGGYPFFYLERDGWRDDETGELQFNPHDTYKYVVCPKCAGTASERDAILTDSDVNWEDPDLYCDNCNERIESAYAEED